MSDPDFFPIAVWLQAPANAPQYAELGINTYVGLWKGPTDEQLRTLARHKMRVICDQNDLALRHPDNAIIIGWMHGDEPDNAQSMSGHWKNDADAANRAWPGTTPKTLERWGKWGPPIPPADIVAGYERMRRRDPTRPVFLNLGMGVAWDAWHGRGIRTNKPEDYPEYARGADIVSFDIYPAVAREPQVRGKLELVPYGVRRLRTWTDDRKIVWNCIEASRISNPDRKPTPSEVRYEVWASLIAGSRGLIYFVHQFKPKFVEDSLLKDAELAPAVKAINHRIHSLAQVLNSPTMEGAVRATGADTGEPVDVMVKRGHGDLYLFTALSRSRGEGVVFELTESAARAVRAESLEDERVIPIREGRFEDRLQGYGVGLYRIILSP